MTNLMIIGGNYYDAKNPLLLLSFVLPIAVSAFGDTVTLRNGTRYDGAFVQGSTGRGIAFKDTKGVSRRFAIRDIQSLEFSPSTDSRFVSQPAGSTARSTRVGSYKTISSGTELSLRTNDAIDSKTATAGQKFSAVMYQDVLDSTGALAISKGSDAELVIRSSAGGSTTKTSSLVLDVDTVTVAGKRYVVSTGDVQQKGRQGIGTNKRTVEMVGGGAAIGALIGAIAGKGKGAAIGAGVGAAAGAGAQVLTKGDQVQVPAETILNFKLEQDLRLEPAS